MDENLLHEFKLLILGGYYNAQSAHDAIFDERKPMEKSVVFGYLAIANSYINSAKAVYICREELNRQEFDEFFNKFRTYSDEVMSSISTNHSPQWSNIEFTSLNEAYEPVVSLLGIVE